MKKHTNKSSAKKSRRFGVLRKPNTLLGLCASLAAASSAFGQAAPAPSETDKKDEAITLEKVVVTGSHIPTTQTAGEATAYPVISLDRSAIDLTGLQNTAALLQKMTVANSGAIPISNNATGFTPGATGVSLHGLGPETTLVMLNGHRLATYPVGQSGDTAFVDLNTIPQSMIDSIDVVKDGASAVYGADAVAGVINLKLRKNYDGTELFTSYQNTTDKDSHQFTASMITGVSNDNGSITVGLNYQTRAAIYQRDRAYSAVPAFLSSNSSPINAQISILSVREALNQGSDYYPTGVDRDAFFTTPGPLASDGLPKASDNHGDTKPGDYIYSNSRRARYNYNQDAMSFPKWNRYGAIVNGEHNLFGTKNVKAYYDASAQYSYTQNELAPAATGDFATAGQTTLVIPARTPNPILTIGQINDDGLFVNATQVSAGTALPEGFVVGPGTQLVNGLVQRVAASGAYNPNNPFNQDISGGTRFRLKEFGNRIFRTTNQALMGSAGIRAENLWDKFNFDAGFSYSQIEVHGDDTLVSASRFNDVLNAASNLFVSNPGLQPYNPFGYYANPIASNAGALSVARVRVHDTDMSRLATLYANASTGSLFTLPAGDVGAAVGVDYRDEHISQSPDALNSSGDIIGSSPAAITDHGRKVFGVYAELRAPLISPKQNIKGLYSLNLEIAGRHEEFLTRHSDVTVPKVGLLYSPFDKTLAIRATASEGFLEPSLYQMYAGPIAALLQIHDPRPAYDVELPETPTLVSGNSSLKAEKSKAYTAGIVWSPEYAHLKGFNLNIDFWQVERDGTATYDFQNTVDRWAGVASGGLLEGERVVLDAAGNIGQVVTVYHNAGKTTAKGVDIQGSYFLPTNKVGKFTFTAALSYLASYKHSAVPGATADEYVNETLDGEGQDAYLRKKGRLDITWGLRSWGANLAANYLDGFNNYDLDVNPVRTPSTWTFDAQVSYAFSDRFGRFARDSKLTVGVINLLDQDPPLSQYAGANPNNYPGHIYTSEGRMVYVSLNKKF